MDEAKNCLDRIITAVTNLTHLEKSAKDSAMTEDEKKVIDSTKDIYGKFEAAMDDDFNTADAISAARPGARRETLEAYIKRLEKLEERVHSVEVILLFMTINGLLTSIVNLLKSRKKQ